MAVFLIISSVLCLALAASIVPRRTMPGAVPFLGLLVGIALYAFGYAAGLLTPVGGANRIWNLVQYFGAASLPAFWIWMSLEVPRPTRLENPVVPLALLIIPALTIVLNATNEVHHLFYRDLSFVAVGGLTLERIVPGPWYFVHVAFTLVGFFVGIVTFVTTWRKFRSGPRSPYLGITVASVPSVAIYLLYLGTSAELRLDFIPLGLTVTAFLFFWLLWPFRLFDLRPLTREAVFRLVPDPVLIIDPQNRVVDWNPAAETLFPGLDRQRSGQPVETALAGLPEWAPVLLEPSETTGRLLSLGNRGASWWSLTVCPVRDSHGRSAARVCLFHEQTELVHRAEVYRHLALTDDLTGCLNRRAFLERTGALLASRQNPVSLVAIDLDHFKNLNDTWGHQAGDEALRHAVRLWEGVLRPGDLLGRTGGEEFAVFLPGSDPDIALGIAGRLCRRMREAPFVWEGRSLTLTASFGVTGTRDGAAVTVETLLRNADEALYQAKNRGRDQTVLGQTS